MNHPARLPLLALLGFSALLPLARAQTVYINETFESETLGNAPSDSAQYRTSLTTIVAGNATIGTGGQVAELNDNSASGASQLEYNVGGSALGSLYVQFDLLNNAPSGTGSGTQPMIFGIGNWSTSTSALLGATTNRGFGVEFSGVGDSATLKIRVAGTAVYTGTYTMTALQTVKIFINDNDTNTLNYLLPGTSTVATLAANSAVVFINDSLFSTETSAGFVMSTTTGSGNTTGDATLGRLGFNTSSTTINDFLIDNLYVSSFSAVPEPSSFAALAGVAILGFALWRRRRA